MSVLLQGAVLFIPALNHIFHTEAFSLWEVLSIVALGSVMLVAEEARKLVARWWARRHPMRPSVSPQRLA